MDPPTGDWLPTTPAYPHVKDVHNIISSLYGFTINQTYRYYRLFPKDFTFHRMMVRVLRYYE